MHCTNCNITWQHLHAQQGEGDEVYEFCPVCKTDMYLQPSTEETGCMQCPFTGDIIKVATREKLNMQPAVIVADAKPFDVQAWQKKKNELQAEQDERIAYYQQLYEMQGREVAEEYYYNSHNIFK